MKKKVKKPGWIAEFKEFAIKGNALSMAVGVIIGGGFSTITKSLTDDIIMPIVSMFLGGVNFSQWYITLPQLFGPKLDEAGNNAPFSVEIEFTQAGPKDLAEINTAVQDSAEYLKAHGFVL